MLPSQQVVEPLLAQFQQLFLICKLLGIYPHDLTTFRNKITLVKSKIGFWYVLLMMVIYVILYNLLIYSFTEEDRSLKASQSTLTLVIGVFLTYIGLIMMIADQITALRNQSHIGEVYERIRVVDERLFREHCVIDSSKLAMRIRFMIITTIVFELSIMLATYVKLSNYSNWMSLLWCVSIVPTFTNSLDKIWFAVSLYALKERFESINTALEELVSLHEKYKSGAINANFVDADTSLYEPNLDYLYKELGGLDRVLFTVSAKNKVMPVVRPINSIGETTESSHKHHINQYAFLNVTHGSELNDVARVEEKLNNLCKVHDEICEICKTLNELWSYPILILMAYGFLIFTAQLYFLYCATQGQAIPSMFRSAKNAIITVTALTYTSGKCIYIIYLSWKTTLASKRTGINLHKCGVAVDDNMLYEIVNHLSLKLLNHSVDFSACGFFTLDMETLYAVSGGITSYLIILIQFNLAAQQAKDAIQTFTNFNDTAGFEDTGAELDNGSSITAAISDALSSITDL